MMKKLFVTMALLGSLCTQAMAETVGDTLVIEKPDKVRIETRDTVQRILITGSKDDPDLLYRQSISISSPSAVRRTLQTVNDFKTITVKKNGKESTVDVSLHVNLGLDMMVNNSEGNFKFWPAFELGFTLAAEWHPFGKRNVWSTGLGVNWREFKSEKDKYWAKFGDVMALSPYLNGEDPTSTTLRVFSLQVPVTYTHYFDDKQGLGITVGGIVNFNTGAHASRRYDYKGEDYEVKTSAIGQRPVTVDALAVVHIPSFLDIYCKYSPMKFFKDGRGPKMQQLSIGFAF